LDRALIALAIEMSFGRSAKQMEGVLSANVRNGELS